MLMKISHLRSKVDEQKLDSDQQKQLLEQEIVVLRRS